MMYDMWSQRQNRGRILPISKKKNVRRNTLPWHILLMLLNVNPALHSQRYEPSRFVQPWPTHTLPVRHSSMSKTRVWRRGTSQTQHSRNLHSFGPALTFTVRAVLTQMIPSPTIDYVPAADVGTPCVDTSVASMAGTVVGHALVYI